MARRERRFLGDLDAATDDHFQQHFVESSDLARIHTSQSDIIYGSKGVGKTALRRALSEIHASAFFAAKTIDLDQISFTQVHEALAKLKDTSKTEIATLARNTWRNVLAMYCLEAVSEHLPANHSLRTQICKVLTDEGFANADSNNRLVGQIEGLFLRIAEAGLQDERPTPLGLSTAQLSVINAFPSTKAVRTWLEESSKLVRQSGKVVLICLDGFDSIVDHTPESRRAIFAGLIDAVHKASRDPLIAHAFCFKVFLPKELADDADIFVWDADKHMLNTHYLTWGELDFQSFLKRRMMQYTKTKSSLFQDVWHDYMPDKIRNDTHRIDEPSFSYILRHTLYRPRQLLAHLQRILDRWDERSDSFRIDPTFIPQVVASTNYELARAVAAQLEVKYPGISGFLQSWSGSCNTLLVGEFQDRIRRVFVLESVKEVNDIFNDLYNVGIFGVLPKNNAAKGLSQTRFRFGFVGDRMMQSMHASLDASDLLALSPMFHEFSGCVPSEYGAIIPISA